MSVSTKIKTIVALLTNAIAQPKYDEDIVYRLIQNIPRDELVKNVNAFNELMNKYSKILKQYGIDEIKYAPSHIQQMYREEFERINPVNILIRNLHLENPIIRKLLRPILSRNWDLVLKILGNPENLAKCIRSIHGDINGLDVYCKVFSYYAIKYLEKYVSEE